MKKLIFSLFVIIFCVFFIGCKEEFSVSKDVVFDCANTKEAIIYTENIKEIKSIMIDDNLVEEKEYKFLDNKIFIHADYLKGLGYGVYTFIVNADDNDYDVTIYVTDSRKSKLLTEDLYKYQDANIVIPIELYDATFELSYKGEKIEDFKIEDGKLSIYASFIELCGEENIVLKYQFIYRSLENPQEFLNDSGEINIEKILFGDIEW